MIFFLKWELSVMENNLCPGPWVQLSVEPNGNLRFCCYGHSGKDVRDDSGKLLSIKDFKTVASALNHPSYKKIRVDMVNGVYPKFCNKCHELENLAGGSPRISLEQFHYEHFKKSLGKMNSEGTIEPIVHTLDLTLGNLCNLKCRMCSPFFSSGLKKEFSLMGLEYSKDEVSNIETFWSEGLEEYPLLIDALKTVRRIIFLGGEPLLSPFHTKVLSYLVENGRSTEVSLAYNTNLTVVPDEILNYWDAFLKVHLDISLEGTPDVNDFIRSGSRFVDIEKNIEKVYSRVGNKITFNICTVFQAYNIHNICDWLDFLKTWKDYIPRFPDFIHLDFPNYLSAKVLPLSIRETEIRAIRKKMKEYEFSSLTVLEKDHFLTLEGYLKDLEVAPWEEERFFDFLLFSKKMDALRNESTNDIMNFGSK